MGDPFGGHNKYKDYKERAIGGGRGRGSSHYAEARGLGIPPKNERGLGYVDEGRRGHFIPSNARGEQQHVRVNNPDLQLTNPNPRAVGGRANARNSNIQPEQPRAIAMGDGPATRTRAPAAAGPARAAPQRINNYQAPRASKGPARAG